MAVPNGHPDRGVTVLAELASNPRRFDFYQALRRIEGSHPDSPRFGDSKRPAGEPVRLCQDAELDFAGSNLSRTQTTRQGRLRLFVRFLGLFGPHGALPIHITEFVRDRERNRADPTLGRFIDLFHHRLLSLFYRAWRQAQPTASRDHPQGDRFKLYVGALVGYGSPAHERPAGLDAAQADRNADQRRYFAGILSRAARSPEGLAAILSQQLALPVTVECFVPRWVRLPQSEQSRLGRSGSAILGATAVVGARVLDAQSQIELRVGPMPLERYRQYFPGGVWFREIRKWLLTYSCDEYSASLRPLLQSDEVPTATLGREGRLGFDTWLGQRGRSMPADDLMLWISAMPEAR